MGKIIEASCESGIVTADENSVAGAVILSEGIAPSDGVLILQDEKQFYVAKTSGDLKDLIQSVCDILTNVVTVLSSHDSGLGSTQTATIALITTAKTALLTKKENLK